ncbi:MAG TPA: bifunctional hydroxymethylpyrimidine kinase/phosphomethylpyrimidine kinase [Nakamurella sp.]|jgi:hydroxymethylpyrimidine kinase/phosphomethylpyrimidine kinase
MTVRVLSIAGSDPSGGAGIQADLKTFAAQGAYGMAVIASLTAQNTTGVRGVFSPPASFLAAQLDAISDDITVDAVKIGMLGSTDNIAVVGRWLSTHRPPFVVLDPVMVATSGDRLLDADAESSLRALLPHADLLTPNIAELAVLVGDEPARDLDGAIAQGKALASASGAQVLVKGGHLGAGDPVAQRTATDALVGPDGSVTLVPGPWVETKHTHGTGCTLSSALAALRPQRESWAAAAVDAKAWLTGALAGGESLGVGHGRGPVDHLHALFPAPFSTQVWSRIAPIRAAIETMPFITALADGSLPWANFRFYLAQDACYLREYARCLARVAALAPEQDAQEFFAHASAGALEAELALHRTLLTAHGESLDDVEVSPVTTAYLDHLHRCCATGSYAEAVAAVLPCFWLYQHIGERLGALRTPGEHPYAPWIETYADPTFADLTLRAIGFADRAFRAGSPAERAAMDAAFERSSRYEWMFFAQGTDLPAWPV